MFTTSSMSAFYTSPRRSRQISSLLPSSDPSVSFIFTRVPRLSSLTSIGTGFTDLGNEYHNVSATAMIFRPSMPAFPPAKHPAGLMVIRFRYARSKYLGPAAMNRTQLPRPRVKHALCQTLTVLYNCVHIGFLIYWWLSRTSCLSRHGEGGQTGQGVLGRLMSKKKPGCEAGD